MFDQKHQKIQMNTQEKLDLKRDKLRSDIVSSSDKDVSTKSP